MLKSIDILIGLSVVMLVVSMAVTLLTQAFINVFSSRGRHLLRGLSDMLEQFHPGITAEHAEQIGKMILSSPLIRGGKLRYGDIIHREELTKILLELSAGDPKAAGDAAKQSALTALKTAMQENGIPNPDETLGNVRMMALHLEKSNPELSNAMRHNMALLQEASSQFLAKTNLWFDQTMDRVSERFTFSARICTFISAAVVAIVLQLDTVTLVNRLAMDDAMREAFVRQGQELAKSPSVANAVQGNAGQQQAAAGTEQPATPPVGTPPQGQPAPQQAADDAVRRQYLGFLAAQGVINPPDIKWKGWRPDLTEWNAKWRQVNIFGVFISILLLSLGAPFWYSALSKLLQLRSALARKDDDQRVARQTTQGEPAAAAAAAGGGPGGAVAVAGERGDLSAIG